VAPAYAQDANQQLWEEYKEHDARYGVDRARCIIEHPLPNQRCPVWGEEAITNWPEDPTLLDRTSQFAWVGYAMYGMLASIPIALLVFAVRRRLATTERRD